MPSSFTIDAGLNGLLLVLSERLGGPDAALAAWLDEVGAPDLAKLATTDEDVWTYFELLASDGPKDALAFIGGAKMHERTVLRACDRTESAFLAWRALRPAAPLGQRLRSSALAG